MQNTQFYKQIYEGPPFMMNMIRRIQQTIVDLLFYKMVDKTSYQKWLQQPQRESVYAYRGPVYMYIEDQYICI